METAVYLIDSNQVNDYTVSAVDYTQVEHNAALTQLFFSEAVRLKLCRNAKAVSI